MSGAKFKYYVVQAAESPEEVIRLCGGNQRILSMISSPRNFSDRLSGRAMLLIAWLILKVAKWSSPAR
jgi:hypothetical protein